MARVCVIVVAGLDGALLSRVSGLAGIVGNAAAVRPVFPAVTCTMQASLTTGELPGKHGIVANGLYTHGDAALAEKLDLSNLGEFRREVSFWEQSNDLLDAPRFWAGMGKKVALLFFQNSMPGKTSAADIVVTPKPEHTPDGKTLTACWSNPRELYGELTAKFGPFPLHQYWSPMAGIGSSQWIINSALEVWERHSPDLQLVYVPHMDYCLQRQGATGEGVAAELAAVDKEIARLTEAVKKSGGIPVIVGDYGMNDVRTCNFPNVCLRQAQLLKTKLDGSGKYLVDYAKSEAFAMVDHQVAQVYCRRERVEEVTAALYMLPAVDKIVSDPGEIAAMGLGHKRAGNIVLLAQKHAWFAHDWWTSEAEKPIWQFGVDIHRKPGYDPRELFFDPVKKIIQQSVTAVKGSHGLVEKDESRWPVVMCEAGLPEKREMTAVAGWLKGLMERGAG
jgi:predicted AlkP superfamily pyrophosphatase or phosphodiesterase